MQAEPTAFDLSGHPAADLDRLTGAVERGPTGKQGGTDSLTTQLNGPAGTKIATAKFEFNQGYVTVTIETTGTGQLSPGFHGVHIHSVGKCEANSAAPTGGAPGDFLSAGGHFMARASTEVATRPRCRSARTVERSGDHHRRVHQSRPAGGAGTSIVIHAGADNFGNIPADRYNQVNGAPGPDQTTMSTGDAGKRVACGVIGSG